VVGGSLDGLKLTDVEKQLEQAQTLFPPVLTDFRRRDGFQLSFRKICNDLPRNKDTIYENLDCARKTLIKHDETVESTFPPSIELNSSKDDIYEKFTRVFSASRGASRDMRLDFIPDIYTRLKKEEKRPHPESTNDTGVAWKARGESSGCLHK
jgi:hypothetical protein